VNINKQKAIYTIVSKIPKGKVLTYKKVATLAHIANPRFVGWVLHQNTNPKEIPCHRVVRSDGTIAKGYAFGGAKKQKELLRSEGVVFKNNRVDLMQCLF